MKVNTQELRSMNLMKVYRYVYEQKQATKTAIAYALQLSLPTVTQDLNELLETKKIIYAEKSAPTGGRPATVYQFNSCFRISIGVEVLANKVRLASIDLYGQITKEDSLDIVFVNDPSYYEIFGKWVNHFIDSLPYSKDAILGIIISIQGIVAKDHEHILYGKLLNSTDFTRTDFARHFCYPVSLIHDAEAAAIAEVWHMKQVSSAIYLSLNPHMGSAFIINNSVVHTKELSSGTVEHMILYHGKEECYCGKSGCADVYCSANSLMRMAGKNLPDFFQQLENGDETCQKIWRQYLSNLALLIDNIRMVINCDVIIGGLLEKYISDSSLDDLAKIIASISTFGSVTPIIIRGHYGNKATMIGSALTAIKEYLSCEKLDGSAF